MTGPEFMRYLTVSTRSATPTWIEGEDPSVEFYDGRIRITDQRGEDFTIARPLARQLRILAFQLSMVADEIDRRGFEMPDPKWHQTAPPDASG